MKEDFKESIKNSIEENVNKFEEDDEVFVIAETAEMRQQAEQSMQARKQEQIEGDKLLPKEVMYEYGEMNPDQYRNAYFTRENMKQDTAKLGSKVRFKPNPQEQKMNERIDQSKAISKKATAYTLDVSEGVKNANAFMENKANELADNTIREKTDSYLTLIEEAHFTPKMFTSAYIRKHMQYCVILVKAYSELKALFKSGYRPDLEEKYTGNLISSDQSKRFDDISEIMDLYTKRVNEYTKKNHVDIEDGKGYDKELESYEKIDDENYHDWLSLVGDAKAKRKEDRMRNDLKNVSGTVFEGVDDETIEMLSQTKEIDLRTFELDMDKEFNATGDKRVERIPEYKAYLKEVEQKLKSGDFQDDDTDIEIAKLFKQKMIQVRAFLRLAEVELEFAKLRAKDGEENLKDADSMIKNYPDLCERYRKAWDDVRKVYSKDQKNIKEGYVEIEDERTMPSGIHTLSREEALSTYSDRKSMDARIDLLRSSSTMERKLRGITEVENLNNAIGSYFDKNVYKSGEKAESDALLKVIRASKDAKIQSFKDHPEVKALLDKIDSLTKGNLNVPEGVEVIDKSHGERPETRGKRKFEHWFAKPLEDFYKFFRKWQKPADDTPLFAHEPTVNDLRQGKVSNCWMVAGTCTAINYEPNIIKDCMKDNGDGTVTVRLYKNEKNMPTPVYIKVTKEVPKLITGGAIHTSGALWMQILEKAAAFLGYSSASNQDENAGYDALWHGKPDDWVFALTGRFGDRIIGSSMSSTFVDNALFSGEVGGFSKQKSDSLSGDGHHLRNDKFKAELFNQLINARRDGKIFTYGTKASNTPGMNAGHAYTVVSAGEDADGRFVIMRNPYGNMSAKYKDDGSLCKTDSYISSSMNETCGMFKISYEDFLKNCGGLSMIDMKSELKERAPEPNDIILPQELINDNSDDF